MGKPTISIAVIAKNEADRIGRLLERASFADEVVVVDSGSRDGTQALCEQAGAMVIFNEWPGYANQKNFAMEQTTSEWILNLDADEEVSAALAAEISNAVRYAAPEVHAFSMPRLSRYLGRWIKHGGWYPDRKVRLVRKGNGKWSSDQLHEKLLVDGKVERLSEPILHHVYRHISDQVKTIDRFSDIYAVQRAPAGSGFVLAGAGHALGKFLECYVWKLGVLDGIPGLIIAMNSAWYVFLKHAKAWERGFTGEK
uniref:Glycosyltransferase family 2 protein n=1 Tax=Candidatus Desulfatibia profunda TaxID=2841695 RepID=A0A8J6NN11_9BACT|nr:glycosyltransferase family 2 protein [Candidatus Desulfatibia profunda]